MDQAILIWGLGGLVLLGLAGAFVWWLQRRRAEAARAAAALAAQAETDARRQRALAAAGEARRAAQHRAAEEQAQAAVEAAAVAAAAEQAARLQAAHELEQAAARQAARQAEEARRQAQFRAEAQAAAEAARAAAAEQEAAARARAAQAALAAVAPPPPRAPVAPAAPVRRLPQDTLVMVADDSKVVRVKTSRLLTQHGYRVVLAEDGAQAAQLLDVELPAVLITDVEMPGLDGLALTRHVRKHPLAAHIPIIMITSADDRLKDAAAEAGVTLVLGKPYPEAELIACIERSQATVIG